MVSSRFPSLVLLTLFLLPLPAVLAAQASDATRTGETLEDFFTAALEHNPELRIAEERLRVGAARKRAASGQLLPQLSANAALSDNRRETIGPAENFDGERYSLQLRQVLFNWQAFAARRQASLSEDQLEAEYYHELGVLLTSVAERYFDVLEARDALASMAAEIEALESQLQQVQALRELELIQITDLHRVQANLAASGAEEIRLRSEVELAELALRAVSGLAVGALLILDDAATVPVLERTPQDYVRLARENNYLVAARESAVAVAEARIDERRGAIMPQVSVVAQHQNSNVGFDNAPIRQTDNTYLGLDISIPLYAGGTNRARVQEARGERNIAQHELRQVSLEAEQRVRSALLQFQASDSLIEAARLLLESTTVNAEAMREGFALGSVTTVDVLDALRDQFRAERDLQQARYAQIRALLNLKRAAGILTAEDLLEVGGWLVPAAE